MKRTLKLSMAATLLAATFWSFTYLLPGEDALITAGISADDARSAIKGSLEGGYMMMPYPNKLKSISVTDRARIIRGIGMFAKAYVATAEFAQDFNPYLEGDSEPPTPPQKPEAVNGDPQAQMIQSMKDTYQNFLRGVEAQTNPEVKRQLQESAAELKRQIEEMEAAERNLTPEEREERAASVRMMNGAMNEGYEKAMEQYRQELAQWQARQKSTEADRTPKGIVKIRLKEFLAATEGVDYGATLVPRYGKKYFANPAYEAKPAEWKMAFRAGREATEAARQFAREWLAELESGR